MSIETTAAGGALIKIFGVPVLVGAAGTAVGFMLLWPKTMKEAFARFACSILSSLVIGPLLVIVAHAWWPGLFDAAKLAGQQYAGDPQIGLLYVAAPFYLAAALPAWWILGALVLWLDKRRGKDIAEIAHDAAAAVHDVRGAL
jgi:uncharacterized membrane protein YsdA (DUF1294 family)